MFTTGDLTPPEREMLDRAVHHEMLRKDGTYEWIEMVLLGGLEIACTALKDHSPATRLRLLRGWAGLPRVTVVEQGDVSV